MSPVFYCTKIYGSSMMELKPTKRRKKMGDSQSKFVERRQHPRVSITRSGICHWQQGSVMFRLLNMSANGALLVLTEELPVGTYISFHIDWDSGGKKPGIRMALNCQVVRVTRQNNEYHAGVSITKIHFASAA